MLQKLFAKQTAQQDGPQPPPKPLKPEEPKDELPNEQQLKADIFFFTFFEPHFGHFVSFSLAFILWNTENKS